MVVKLELLKLLKENVLKKIDKVSPPLHPVQLTSVLISILFSRTKMKMVSVVMLIIFFQKITTMFSNSVHLIKSQNKDGK